MPEWFKTWDDENGNFNATGHLINHSPGRLDSCNVYPRSFFRSEIKVNPSKNRHQIPNYLTRSTEWYYDPELDLKLNRPSYPLS